MIDTQRRFLRGVLTLSVIAFVFFTAEFVLEWYRLDQPNFDQLSWGGGAPKSDNKKLVDVLSPVARAYNNMLAMLLATVGLAIPLTANMHTPKLIDMFLRDRINQVMLAFGALGAANVLWVAYIVGPEFAPLWAYRVAVMGAIVGWVFLIPYFFYVVRFLDPSNILNRLEQKLTQTVDQAAAGQMEPGVARQVIHDQLFQIGTLVLKAIDRADRGVAAEGIWTFKKILDHYRPLKARMPEQWFHVERRDCIGLAEEAIEILVQERTWFEHQVLWQMYLAYQNALAKTQDAISSLSDALRVIALASARHKDEKVLELTVRFFNNFLREAIKRRDIHAIYDLLYQYRELASELLSQPDVLRRIGRYIRTYTEIAGAAGMNFVPQFGAFDLGLIVSRAFEHNNPAAPALLDEMLLLKHFTPSGEPLLLVVKAKAILGGMMIEGKQKEHIDRLRTNLADVPPEVLAAAERDLVNMKDRSFWEVTDRQINFEWVVPERRPALQAFFATLRRAAA